MRAIGARRPSWRLPHRACLERDGDLGVLVLDDPPLNLFGREMVADLLAALDAGRRRASARWSGRRGRYFTGGVDVHVFDGLSAAEAEEFVAGLLAITHRIEDLPFPTLASVHGLCLTAGLRAVARLRHDLGGRVGAVRAGRDRGGAHAADGRHAAGGGAGRPRPGARARDERRALRRRDARALERRQPRAADGELAEKSLRFAKRLAAGPTLANAATKRMVRAQLDHGVRGADERIAAIGAPAVRHGGPQGAVSSFLEDGPGQGDLQRALISVASVSW